MREVSWKANGKRKGREMRVDVREERKVREDEEGKRGSK